MLLACTYITLFGRNSKLFIDIKAHFLKELFARQDETDVGFLIFFDEVYKLVEVPLKGKPLHSIDVKHVRKTAVPYGKDLLFYFFVHF